MEYAITEVVLCDGPLDPPDGSGWRIVSTTNGDDDTLWVIWERKKPGRRTAKKVRP